MINKEILYFEEVTSTNDKLRELAEQGCESGTVVRAGMQTGGRGRRGRVWESRQGEGLYMSILLRPRKEIKSASLLSPVTGLGVCKTAEYFLGGDIKIKWPNDVLCGGRKLSGILTETVLTAGSVDFFITGIGININNADFPAGLEGKATSFYIESGKKFVPEDVAVILMDELDILYDSFINDGFSHLDEYKKRCVNIGSQVKLIYEDTELCGIATGISETGELLVQTQGGETIGVNSGEVSVRGIAGYV